MSAPRIDSQSVAARITAARAAINASDIPDLAGRVALIGPPGAIPDDVPYRAELRELLRVVNGMRCDGVGVTGSNDLRYTDYSDLLEGGSEKWLCIGDFEYVPVFMERSDGTIWHSMDAGSEDFADVPMAQIAPDIWSFVGWYAMGPGHLEIFPDEDGIWVQFLKEHNLFDWEDPA